MASAKRSEFPGVAEVFLEPVPPDDETVQTRVRTRYGNLAQLVDEAGPERSGSSAFWAQHPS